MGQTTILVMILTIISKLFGFVRESVMAAFIGAGEIKSIYTTAMTIPNMFTSIVMYGVLSTYIPIYNMVKNDKGEENAKLFTYNLINILMFYGIIILLFLIIFAEPISKIFSPDLSGDSLDLAVSFSRITSFSIFAYLYSSVIRGYLHINNNFYDPVIVGIILNIIIIIATILTGIFKNPYILMMGTLFAQVLQFIRFPFASKKLGLKYKKILDFNNPYLRKMLLMTIPIILSSAADQISILVDNSMASAFFGVTSVSKIFYSKTMLDFIMGVVTMTIASVSFPNIAKLGQSMEIDKMKKSVSSAVIITMILIIPCTFGMMALSNPIIKLAFERKAFTVFDTYVVSGLIVAYGPFIIFSSFIRIIGNSFYSVGDTKTPVIIILFQQAVNIILNFILIKFFKLYGLALATSISTAMGSLMIILAFYKRFGKLESMENIKSIVKITMASIIMAIVAYFIYDYSLNKISYILALLISVLFSGILYILIIFVFKINEVDRIKNYIMNKLERK
ncbi:murein biosynthesis integral membrane protein MurJ [Anaerococcus tetradius]|uniref:Probable lipid II flippase MurJ n=1 Tax=Anaerococcus tetradius TaxID=33036 RepID=A0A133KEV3_9FIRM|nr:murein biosynthesis integral membrane protein MurJ [Anaerococcus tetradius]KWZ78060.1 integral membrane protein MviN [Anaerococcus tetradius]